jgi:hypothetical protein
MTIEVAREALMRYRNKGRDCALVISPPGSEGEEEDLPIWGNPKLLLPLAEALSAMGWNIIDVGT